VCIFIILGVVAILSATFLPFILRRIDILEGRGRGPSDLQTPTLLHSKNFAINNCKLYISSAAMATRVINCQGNFCAM